MCVVCGSVHTNKSWRELGHACKYHVRNDAGRSVRRLDRRYVESQAGEGNTKRHE
jgi:hypothetical protein